MKEEIINRVAKSKLITIDLAEYFPKEEIVEFDIKSLLYKEAVLKEKEFRLKLKSMDFVTFKGKIIALFCSKEAIIPMWAYMLISSHLSPYCDQIYCGKKETVIQHIMLEKIKLINENEFLEKKVIVKGCGSIPLSESLYIGITKKLQNTVSSLMFGEACSAVPIYKKRK